MVITFVFYQLIRTTCMTISIQIINFRRPKIYPTAHSTLKMTINYYILTLNELCLYKNEYILVDSVVPWNLQIVHICTVWTLEKTEGAFKNGQSRETGNIGHQTQNENKSKQKHTTQKNKKKMKNTDHIKKGVHER